VVDAAAARTGWPVAAVGALLAGPPPPDDPSLVALAGEIDRLRAAVREASGAVSGGA
jgi:hypothetical protein